jgi:hypothetical protein
MILATDECGYLLGDTPNILSGGKINYACVKCMWVIDVRQVRY